MNYRPIKFRFWDDTTKQFFRPAAAEFNGVGELYTIRVGNKNLGLERISINQFTGQLDMNGVEIYEGDIVKQLDKGNQVIDLGIVEFNDGAFMFRLPKLLNSLTYFLPRRHHIEVIGSIYQNPELLNNSKGK